MLRGTKKQIIHLKHTESPLFEEAFLIVKQLPQEDLPPRTLAEEANRLLTGQTTAGAPAQPVRRMYGMKWAVLAFLLGALSSAAMLLLYFLV